MIPGMTARMFEKCECKNEKVPISGKELILLAAKSSPKTKKCGKFNFSDW